MQAILDFKFMRIMENNNKKIGFAVSRMKWHNN